MIQPLSIDTIQKTYTADLNWRLRRNSHWTLNYELYRDTVIINRLTQRQPAAMDAILETHCISPSFLRTDDFTGFFQDRKATLLNLVEQAMGKQTIVTSEAVDEDDMEAEDESGSEVEYVT